MNVQIYDEPDIITSSDKEVLKELNTWLLKDPNYVLPEGFMKVKEKEVTYDYKV